MSTRTTISVVLGTLLGHNIVVGSSVVRIVFFHFESNQIVELLFEISNRIE